VNISEQETAARTESYTREPTSPSTAAANLLSKPLAPLLVVADHFGEVGAGLNLVAVYLHTGEATRTQSGGVCCAYGYGL
jgi:hypothetical protein